MKSELFKTGDTIYCVDQSSYEQHLTKRTKYFVSEIGSGSKTGMVKIKGDSNRLVWISNIHFSKSNQPNIISVNIDDNIDDKTNDSIDITISFDDETKGWCRVLTPNYLQLLITSNQFYIDKNAIFVNEITEGKIIEIVELLDKSNRLLDILKPYQ